MWGLPRTANGIAPTCATSFWCNVGKLLGSISGSSGPGLGPGLGNGATPLILYLGFGGTFLCWLGSKGAIWLTVLFLLLIKQMVVTAKTIATKIVGTTIQTMSLTLIPEERDWKKEVCDSFTMRINHTHQGCLDLWGWASRMEVVCVKPTGWYTDLQLIQTERGCNQC